MKAYINVPRIRQEFSKGWYLYLLLLHRLIGYVIHDLYLQKFVEYQYVKSKRPVRCPWTHCSLIGEMIHSIKKINNQTGPRTKWLGFPGCGKKRLELKKWIRSSTWPHSLGTSLLTVVQYLHLTGGQWAPRADSHRWCSRKDKQREDMLPAQILSCVSTLSYYLRHAWAKQNQLFRCAEGYQPRVGSTEGGRRDMYQPWFTGTVLYGEAP